MVDIPLKKEKNIFNHKTTIIECANNLKIRNHSNVSNYLDFKNHYFISEGISKFTNIHQEYYLFPEFLKKEFNYLFNLIKKIDSEYFLFINFNTPFITDIHVNKAPLNIKFDYYHYIFNGFSIYSNENIFNKKLLNYSYFFANKSTILKVFSSDFYNIINLTVLPNQLLQSKSKLFDLLLISYYRNQFNPMISYNDLMLNLSFAGLNKVILKP